MWFISIFKSGCLVFNSFTPLSTTEVKLPPSKSSQITLSSIVSFFELAKTNSAYKKFVKKITAMIIDINVIVNCMKLSHLFKFAEGSCSPVLPQFSFVTIHESCKISSSKI